MYDMTGSASANARRVIHLGREGALQKVWRVTLMVMSGVMFLWVAWYFVSLLTIPNIGPAGPYGDETLYFRAARRWLDGGSFYSDYQLAGPYVIEKFEILYPPTIIPLLLVFSFLPDPVWWIAPTAILAGVVLYWRPSLLGWTLILACLSVPITLAIYFWGNPSIWMAAFLALGTRWGWPSVFVLLKPQLFPFALVGIRRRSWWVALAVFALVSVAFLPMWFDWVTVLLNARGPNASPLYGLSSVPLMMIPLIARWSTRRTPTPERAGVVVSVPTVDRVGS